VVGGSGSGVWGWRDGYLVASGEGRMVENGCERRRCGVRARIRWKEYWR